MTAPGILPFVLGETELPMRQMLLSLDAPFADGYRKNQAQILDAIGEIARSNLLIPYFLRQSVAANQLIKMIGAQSYLLHVGEHYLARLNFWPPKSQRQSVVSERVRRYFSIDVLHNHSFDFFTVGILGCGYYSKFYQASLNDLEGRSIGETLQLKFVGDLTLNPGKAIFVAKSTEFHSQHEPEEFSVSLNFIPKVYDEIGSSDCAQLILHSQTHEIERIISVRNE